MTDIELKEFIELRSKMAKENEFDKRPFVGLPGWFKNAKLQK